MAYASLALGVAALLCAIGGFVMSFLPFGIGAALSFGSPLLGLIGIVLGGVALSRAKAEGGESGAAIAGLTVSIVAFVIGLLVALTCGVCNAYCTGVMLTSDRNATGSSWWTIDAGPSIFAPQPLPSPVDPNAPPQPTQPPQPGQPPPAFPPPPIPGDPTQAQGTGICERAQVCCEAYVNALAAPGVSAQSACAAVAQARNMQNAEAMCSAMIDSWRSTLEQQQRPVPDSCAAQ